MSRSRKKTPKRGLTTAKSEKRDKRIANRKFRRKTKIQNTLGESDFVKLREVSNVWEFDKDGKRYIKNPSDKDLRK